LRKVATDRQADKQQRKLILLGGGKNNVCVTYEYVSVIKWYAFRRNLDSCRCHYWWSTNDWPV